MSCSRKSSCYLVWRTEKKAVISDEAVMEKARSLAQDPRLGIEGCIKFSDVWLSNFKKRHGIRGFLLHGESGEVSSEAVGQTRRSLRNILSDYELRNIYNMDETGLFYRLNPRKTLATEARNGKKKRKERVTLVACASADGSDKMPLMMLGKSKNPRCFQGIRKENLGLIYRSSKSAWMTGFLFGEWLKLFCQRVRGRNVVLLLDNASSHHAHFDFVDFDEKNQVCTVQVTENILIVFFPPNLTSAIQPMDQGIIATFKAHYRGAFVKRKLRYLELGKAEELISLLSAASMIVKAWSKIKNTTIANCFRHSGILGPAQEADTRIQYKNSPDKIESAVLDSLQVSLERLGLENDDLSAVEFACPPEETESDDKDEELDVVAQALGPDEKQDDRKEELLSEEDEWTPPKISHKLASESLTALHYYFCQTELVCEEANNALSILWDAFDENVSRSRKQTTITDFFKSSSP